MLHVFCQYKMHINTARHMLFAGWMIKYIIKLGGGGCAFGTHGNIMYLLSVPIPLADQSLINVKKVKLTNNDSHELVSMEELQHSTSANFVKRIPKRTEMPLH